VQNTETTTLKVLGFVTDHERLFSYLRKEWFCEQIFFYPGIQHGDATRDTLFQRIATQGGVVRPKHYFMYKNSDRAGTAQCPACATKVTCKIDMGYTWKCNCDVEMTMDILDHAHAHTEVLIFTGDGDFASLVERVVTCGAKVYLVASARKVRTSPRYATSRFSTRLRGLIAKYPEHIIYLDINDWKRRIQKE
jgi:uncharacterized LabA/DUF88 family protein